ncbi:MAG TPA: DEAD/DEAH box helicase, partial [Tepidisphaeraceae bacterium]|nr:DEAD/DEAH box helicase [Tepidisphaeraceae bacterium]
YTVIFGGVNQNPQVDSLRRGVDVIIATPGRLLDLMNQGHVDLRAVEVLVLDEADRMLDMGFIHDIRRIVGKIPTHRQTMLFSATMPTEIRKLADTLMRDPASVQVAPVSATADGVEQSVYFVEKRNKSALLAHLVNSVPMFRTIVFTRTKHGADRVVRHLHDSGIRAEAIHGNKSQNARQRALKNFRANKIPVLVATDIASRGIDVDGITHVVNYDITDEPETYIHRIGRTARAGASGAAISLCGPDEMSELKAIERLIRKSIPVKTDHPPFAKTATTRSEPAHHEPRNVPQHHRSADRAAHAPRQPHAPRPRPHAPQPQHQSGPRQDAAPSHRQGGRPQAQGHRKSHPIFGKSHPRNGGGVRSRNAGPRR